MNVGLVLVAGGDVVDAVHPADHGLEGVETMGDHSVWDFDGFLSHSQLELLYLGVYLLER